VNPTGLLPCRAHDVGISEGNKIAEYGKDVGFACRRCDEWVPHPPREFVGGVEPVFWWWCFKCRKLKTSQTKTPVGVDIRSLF